MITLKVLEYPQIAAKILAGDKASVEDVLGFAECKGCDAIELPKGLSKKMMKLFTPASGFEFIVDVEHNISQRLILDAKNYVKGRRNNKPTPKKKKHPTAIRMVGRPRSRGGLNPGR